ncbi:MAG: elongation factor P [Bacilli bacterium]
MNVTELRPGNYFMENNNIFLVIDILLNKTAMRKMVAKLKVKNIRTGAITDMSANSGYQVEQVKLDKKKVNYSYDSGDFYVFMDPVSFEQIEIAKSKLEWESKFLTENLEVELTMYEDEILGINLPAKVELTITECQPAVRGDTVNKASKEVTVETGIKLRVPLFVNQGDKVLVRTDTGEYDGRA